MQLTAATTQNLLDRLDKWLSVNRPEYYAELLPGLDAAQLANFEAQLGLALPEDLRLLYRWKNGQSRDSDNMLFDDWTLMESEYVIRTFQMINELLEAGDFERKNWWNVNWIPFLDRYTGDHWCVDLEGTFGGIPGQILEFWHGDEDRDAICPNFHDWLAALVTYFESGLYSDEDDKGTEFWKFLGTAIPGYPIRNDAG